MKYSSKSMRGFYLSEIHGEHMPADAVKITDEYYAALLKDQSKGMIIDWSGDLPVTINPPPLTLPERRTQRLSKINAKAASLLATLTAAYPELEISSWPQQEREAREMSVKPDAVVPLLTAIAAARGLTVLELAERVRDKADAYAVASGQIIGRRQALEDALDAIDLQAPDAASQIEAVQWGV